VMIERGWEAERMKIPWELRVFIEVGDRALLWLWPE
jgi:hypothetical protein